MADDHPAMREGLTQLLAQDHHVVCGEAGNLRDALHRIDQCAPSLALVDLSLGKESGLDLVLLLGERGIPSLVYSMHEDAATVKNALKSGASGYVTKGETSTVLLEAVDTILAGERYISPRATESLEALRQTDRGNQLLSEREQQILTLMASGESNKEIAITLNLSPRTVETYCMRIIVKLDLEGLKALRKYAIRHGTSS